MFVLTVYGKIVLQKHFKASTVIIEFDVSKIGIPFSAIQGNARFFIEIF